HRQLGRLLVALVVAGVGLSLAGPALAVAAAVNWGYVELRRGNSTAAEERFVQALGLRPDEPEALRGLGMAFLHDGREAEALGLLQRSLAAGDMLAARPAAEAFATL